MWDVIHDGGNNNMLLWRKTLNWSLLLGMMELPVSMFLAQNKLVPNGYILIDAGHEQFVDSFVSSIVEKMNIAGIEEEGSDSRSNGDRSGRIESRNPHLTHILITHGHLDHTAAIPDLLNRYPGCQVVCHERERPFLAVDGGGVSYATVKGDHWLHTISRPFLQHESKVRVPSHRIATCREGDVIGGCFECIETPGHTPGSMSYLHLESRNVIVGDAFVNFNAFRAECPHCSIFKPSTINLAQAKESIRKLSNLKNVNLFFPAHDLGLGVPSSFLSKIE